MFPTMILFLLNFIITVTAKNYELDSVKLVEWYTDPTLGTFSNSLLWNGFGVFHQGETIEETAQYCSNACNAAVFHCGAFLVTKTPKGNVCGLFPHVPVQACDSGWLNKQSETVELETFIYKPLPRKSPTPVGLEVVCEYSCYSQWKSRIAEHYDLEPDDTLPLRLFYALIFEHSLPHSPAPVMEKTLFDALIKNPFSFSHNYVSMHHGKLIVSQLQQKFAKRFSVSDSKGQETIVAIISTLLDNLDQVAHVLCETEGKIIHRLVPKIELEHDNSDISVYIEVGSKKPQFSHVYSIGFEFSSLEKSMYQVNQHDFNIVRFIFHAVYPHNYDFEVDSADFFLQLYLNLLLYGNHMDSWKFLKSPFFLHVYLAIMWNIYGGNEGKGMTSVFRHSRFADILINLEQK